MANTANITAVITAQDKASGVLKDFGNNAETANNKVKETANKAAVALGVVGAGLTLYAKNATEFTVEYLKNAKDLSRETGTSIEQSSKLLFVTQRLGISAETVSQQFGFFSKNIVKSSDSFKQLGVDINNAEGKQRSFNDILLDTSDKFRAMPDGVQKTTLAMDLFGRTGKDLIPVLNLGSQGIARLQAEADRLGITLTSNNVVSINKYIESQRQLTDSTNTLKIAVGETTAPVLTNFNERLNSIIMSLIASDSPMRGLTANTLAFGGPALTFIGAAIGMAANIATITQAAGGARAALALLAVPWWISVGIIGAGAVVYAIKELYDWFDRLQDKLNKVDVSLQNSKIKVKGGSSLGLTQQLMNAFKGFAGGGYTGAGGENEVAGVVHRGEYVLPKSAVDQTTGMPKLQYGGASTAPSSVNININAGYFNGSDVEARKYAQQILTHIKDIAGAKNMSVAQLMGI